ncbi:MAG: hypothetical protein M1617_07425 [Actinobacteria bacterium]|nr:hypothetical protein [Actinomycetota bacterium]MCL5888099.1 hypothetical protein [Actinomycetota bacterium]
MRNVDYATYTYDAAGQRTRAVVTRAGATTTTNYVYDGIVLRSLSATQGVSNWRLSYLYDIHSQTYYLSQRHYDPATWVLLDEAGHIVGVGIPYDEEVASCEKGPGLGSDSSEDEDQADCRW